MTTLELFNIVLLSILAFATLAYATLTFFVLREQRRGKKKPVIEEMLRIVIHPLLNDVERERQFLSQSKFEWQHSSKRMVCNSLVPTKSGGEKMVLANFFIEYPEIFKLLFKHELKLISLKSSLINLGDELLSVGFKEKCMELITKYNQSAKRAKLSDTDINYLLTLVIDNTKEVPKTHVDHPFWSANGAQLLSFRDRTDVKNCLDIVEYNRKRIYSLCKRLEAELRFLIKQFIDKYGTGIASPIVSKIL